MIQITALEANLLLYALDKFVNTDSNGVITGTLIVPYTGMKTEHIQHLRNRLFASHGHPIDAYSQPHKGENR